MGKVSLTFEARAFGPVWLAGRETRVALGKTAARFVKAFRTDGSNAYLQKLPGRVSPEGDIILWMGGYDPLTKTFTEIPGVFVPLGSEVGDGFAIRELPKCTMGIANITGPTRNLTKGAHNKLVQVMDEAGYAPDYSYGYSLEYYAYEQYEKDNEVHMFSYWLPCKRE